jgi:hypothetical protein
MTKKKQKIIDLKPKKLEFTLNENTYKLLLFRVQEQNIEVATYQEGKFIRNEIIAFAHIPKYLKKEVRPL